jgi:hypothetical protein
VAAAGVEALARPYNPNAPASRPARSTPPPPPPPPSAANSCSRARSLTRRARAWKQRAARSHSPHLQARRVACADARVSMCVYICKGLPKTGLLKTSLLKRGGKVPPAPAPKPSNVFLEARPPSRAMPAACPAAWPPPPPPPSSPPT